MLLSMSMQARWVSKADPALYQLPDHRAGGPGTHADQPDLCAEGVGVVFHLAQAAVVLA